jgi:hypothetical protein
MMRLLVVSLALLLATGCGDTTEETANNGSNNGANNGSNNGANNGSNNGANNGTNNGANNGSNNGANNGANNGTNNGANNGEAAPMPGDPNYPDAPWPEFALEDFHPASDRFGESYGLSVVEEPPTVTVVVLLAGWCSYCRRQAKALEEMNDQFKADGVAVHLLSINANTANEKPLQDSLIYELDDEGEIQYDEGGEPIYRCTFPLLQDTEEDAVWDAMHGTKDDFFIYKPDGTLFIWLPASGRIPTDLGTEAGRENLRDLILDAFDAP